MTGGEIEVLGYRGMKEYETRLRRLRRARRATCWASVEGQGFKQLMADLRVRADPDRRARRWAWRNRRWNSGLRYARSGNQFGEPLIAFPRVADKLAHDGCRDHAAPAS
jgi:(2S)-methylsuccinyl-CoA dehydrogenase